ncbi:STXB5 protein, partial [Polyodon spathula]|nr:STXB5 protein [Polyodon spathula]
MLQVLYKLKTAKVFDKSRNKDDKPNTDIVDEDPFAIQILSWCPESRMLCVAGVSAHVIIYKFSKQEGTTEVVQLLEVRLQYELNDVESPEGDQVPSLPTPGATSSSQPPAPQSQPSTSSSSSDGIRDNVPCLKVRSTPLKQSAGYQVELVIQLVWVSGEPPQQITSLGVNSSCGLVVFGNSNGLAIVDYLQKTVLLNRGIIELYGSNDPYQRQPRSPRKTRQPSGGMLTVASCMCGLSNLYSVKKLCTSYLTGLCDINEGSTTSEDRCKSPTSGFTSPCNSDDDQKVPNFLERVKTKSRMFSKTIVCDLVVMTNHQHFYNGGGRGGAKMSRKLSLPTELKPDLDKGLRHRHSHLFKKHFSNVDVQKAKVQKEGLSRTRSSPRFKGYSERRVASILKISKTAVHKNKVKQHTLGTTKLQTGRGRKRLSTDRDDRQLIRMSLSNPRSIKVWMEDHQIKTLSWPAQSPDLNPIENLWNVIKRKMDGHKPSNKAELLEFLRQEWHKVTQHQYIRDSSFSRSRSSSVTSIDKESQEAITSFQFCETFTRKTDSSTVPSLWVGTTLGTVLVFVLNLPPAGEQRLLQPVIILPSGTLIRLKGAILRMSFLDSTGALYPPACEPWREPNAPNDKDEKDKLRKRRPVSVSPSASQEISENQYAVICSEKQAKVIALPSQNCIYKHNITETSFVLRADMVQMSNSICLACFCANGHIMTLSLPSLRPLLDVNYLPLTDMRIARTFCFTNNGQALYLVSPTEMQRITYSQDMCENLQEMLGELFTPVETPEAPNRGFFKGLFGGGAQSLDREELFGESVAGKASRSLAQHIPGPGGIEGMKGAASGVVGDLARARIALDERGQKLGELDERTAAMMASAESFSKHAHDMMLKYKDKKWYQF